MKKFFVVALIAVALALASVACGDNDDDLKCTCTVKAHPTPCTCPAAGTSACDCTVIITRTFTIVITGHEDHPVTVKDTRTGKNDTDLQKLGVIAKLTTGLNAQSGGQFETVIDRNLTIEVEVTTAYTRFDPRTGNRFGARLDYILSDPADFASRVTSIIGATFSDNTTD